MSKKPSSVDRVKQALADINVTYELKELPNSTRTAVEAAAAVNCNVSQIVKSLVFRTASEKPILILTSGSNKVDENHVSQILGTKIKFANADYVRSHTGFAIGGVSPYGLKKDIPIYIDRDLLQHPLIWAAAGSSYSVFSILPEALVETTGGKVIDVQA